MMFMASSTGMSGSDVGLRASGSCSSSCTIALPSSLLRFLPFRPPDGGTLLSSELEELEEDEREWDAAVEVVTVSLEATREYLQ